MRKGDLLGLRQLLERLLKLLRDFLPIELELGKLLSIKDQSLTLYQESSGT